MINIVIGGDLCPSGEVEKLFKAGHSEKIFNDLLPIFKSADFSIVNLECPLIKTPSPISKDGAVLGATGQCINGLKEAQIHAVNLANNHILDHNEQGIQSTIKALSKNQISYFGAGKNIFDAQKPFIQTIKNKRFGFIGIAEHEFSIAGKKQYGANPLDIIENFRTIRQLKQNVDHVIVLFHGGKEHYPYPTPNQQKACRFFIEEGVDAVICQHSHIIGSYEKYRNGLIVYGQGNLLFENATRNKNTWFEGFLVSLKFNNDSLEFEFIPFEQSKNGIGTKLLDTDKTKEILNLLNERAENVSNTDFVESEWLKLCKQEIYLYASRIHGHNRLLRILNRKICFSNWFYSSKTKNMIRNVIECETHREGLETLWKSNKL